LSQTKAANIIVDVMWQLCEV